MHAHIPYMETEGFLLIFLWKINSGQTAEQRGGGGTVL